MFCNCNAWNVTEDNRRLSRYVVSIETLFLDSGNQSIARLRQQNDISGLWQMMETELQSFSLDDLWKLSCAKLKDILKKNGQPVSGNKEMLVARCYSLNTVTDEKENEDPSAQEANVNPLSELDSLKAVTYTAMNCTAKGRQWVTDLTSEISQKLTFISCLNILLLRLGSMRKLK